RAVASRAATSTLSLHAALPIFRRDVLRRAAAGAARVAERAADPVALLARARRHRLLHHPAHHRGRVPGPGPAGPGGAVPAVGRRSEEHTSELQSRENLVCRLLL